MIPALALLIFGYDVAYYAANVLVWAHLRTDGADPVPFRYCLGIPVKDGGGGAPFRAPIRLGFSYPNIKAAEPRAFFGEGNFAYTQSTLGQAITDFFTKPGAEVYGTGVNSTNPVLPQNGGGGTIGRVPTGGIVTPSGPGVVGANQGLVYGLLGGG